MSQQTNQQGERMSKKSNARRKERRQAMFAQWASPATGRGSDTSDGTNLTKPGDANRPRLQLVMNRLWMKQIPQEQTNALVSIAVREIRDGYWLRFPIVVWDGAPRQSIALVAKHDHRTRAIREVVIAPGTTHLAMLLLFNTTEQWSDNAAKITRLWPEQSGFPEEVKVLSDTQVTSYTKGPGPVPLGVRKPDGRA
jgi:hypothetical protein